jgi:hypothetical protein
MLRRMKLHVVLLAGQGGFPKGLCGATVTEKSLYFGKVPDAARWALHLCPVCKTLALATTGQSLAESGDSARS